MKPIAKMRFAHDLEDGWYDLYLPDGTRKEFNHSKDAIEFAQANGWDLVWEGDPYYMPDYFKQKNQELF